MILDIINKKRLGEELTYKELDLVFNGYLNGDVYDYQMSSLLMAICINGMSDEEIFALTKIFIDSGDVLEFDDIEGIKVDKHSTGGIGDKTTLVITPIVASLGIPVIKMSGRGLGYTGGTIDKLESIPGYRIDLSDDEIIKQVKDINVVITGQTASLVPMDKAIYALRDVTATVSSIPLIASSIMSKKIAGGADKILIDIKVGNGALLEKMEDAQKLSELMIKIGKVYDREVRTIISGMNTPLGSCIGNSLEVIEAMDILNGKITSGNLYDLCIELSTEMVSMGKNISNKEAKELVLNAIESKEAYNKFLELVERQGGNIKGIAVSRDVIKINSKKDGTLEGINALELGKVSLELGAGKKSIDDKIDYTVGVKVCKNIGDVVKKGDLLMEMYVQKCKPKIAINNIFEIV